MVVPNASTVAAARREVPPILDDQAQILGPSVRCAAYALPNNRKIVKTALTALKTGFSCSNTDVVPCDLTLNHSKRWPILIKR